LNELELLKTAYRASPGNLDLARLLALQLTRAEAWGDLLIELEPLAGQKLEPWLQLVLGRAALRLGDAPRALAFLLPACEADELAADDRAEALSLCIFAHLANGENSAAEETLNRLLDLAPNRPSDDLVAAFTARGLSPRRLLKQKNTDNNELSGLTDFTPLAKTRNLTRFADIGGMETLKEAARMKIILPFRQPELFKKYGKAAGGGILLYGPPGCGKTYFARAIAGECEATFFNIGIHDILNLYIGNSERNVKRLFDTARSQRPAILFIDELDALGRKRDLMRHSNMTGTINAFLAELDGVDSDNENLLVIGATNAPWDIDSAFKRPGRFDQLFFVPPPDEAARAAILNLHFASKPCEGIDTGRLAKDTEHFSGADLAALADTAASRVLTEILNGSPERPIRMDDVQAAKKSAKPTTGEWIATARNYVEYANEGGDYDAVADYLSGSGRPRMGF
jgi:SpoVK/Ycf46/Vps4 family AAA+-type ATPase